MRPSTRLAVVTLVGLFALSGLVSAQDGPGRWIGAWSTGPLAADPPPPSAQTEPAGPRGTRRIHNQTIRQIVHTSIGSTGSTADTNSRWPDFLARRLAAEYGDRAPAVINVGIAGNRVLSHNAGLGILQRAGIPAPETDVPLNPNALFDFDAAVRDPSAPTKMRADYHPGDWLHPNDVGYEAMAETIDLTLFAATDKRRSAAGTTGPRTPWGAPDLVGIWDFRTVTPLERPAALADKAVFTPEEAAEFQQASRENLNADRRDGGAQADVERAYNDFWWDWGDGLTEDRRTSLIVDPADGRVPARVEGIDEEDNARRTARRRPIKERVIIGGPATGRRTSGSPNAVCLGSTPGHRCSRAHTTTTSSCFRRRTTW